MMVVRPKSESEDTHKTDTIFDMDWSEGSIVDPQSQEPPIEQNSCVDTVDSVCPDTIGCLVEGSTTRSLLRDAKRKLRSSVADDLMSDQEHHQVDFIPLALEDDAPAHVEKTVVDLGDDSFLT